MHNKHHFSNQHGMATMAITLILLFIGTLVALYTAKTSIKEQQISANQYRADQSLSTADAALDWGVANLGQAGGKFCDKQLEATTGAGHTCPTEIMCTITIADQTKCTLAYNGSNQLSIDHSLDDNDVGDDDALSIGASEMYYAFVDTDGTELEYIPVKGGIGERFIDYDDPNEPPTRIYYANIKVYGIGHSDDETGRRVVSLDVDTSNIFGDPGLGASAFPLITKAATDPNANTAVINRFDNRTIWTGREMGGAISGSTNTYILADGLTWNCNDIAHHEDCVSADSKENTMQASQGQDTVNADIIDGDSNLANLDPNDFFENFFGKTKREMKALAKDTGLYVEADSNGNLTDQDGNAITGGWQGLKDYTPLVWIHLPSGAWYRPGGGEMGLIGTEEDPMVLIIDGNLEVTGVTKPDKRILIGVLYVTGSWDASANMVVQGMVIVETSSGLKGGGGPSLVYDADLFNGKLGPPPGTIAGTAAGTWKDWE